MKLSVPVSHQIWIQISNRPHNSWVSATQGTTTEMKLQLVLLCVNSWKFVPQMLRVVVPMMTTKALSAIGSKMATRITTRHGQRAHGTTSSNAMTPFVMALKVCLTLILMSCWTRILKLPGPLQSVGTLRRPGGGFWRFEKRARQQNRE